MPKLRTKLCTLDRPLFTRPKCIFGKKSAYVYFRFLDKTTNKYKLFRYTGGANYSRISKAERKLELQALAEAWKHKLEFEHFNPITLKSELPTQYGNVSGLTFIKAFDFAKGKKASGWSKKTAQDYASVIKYLNEAAYITDLADVFIRDFKPIHFKTILECAEATRKLTAIVFNKYRTFLSSLIGELIQWDIIETNPVRDIKQKAEIKTFAHKPLTPAERKKVMTVLKKNQYPFYRFCSMLYGTTIREKEILALQIRDIHFKEQVIRIIPDRERENSKVKTEREIVIPDNLLSILKQLKLSSFPEDYFIFSSGGFMMMPFGSAFAINNLHITQQQLPLLFMLAGISTLIVMPLIGKLSDRFDKFRKFAAASVWMIVMVLIYTNLGPTPLFVVIVFNVLMMAGIMSRMIPSRALITEIPSIQDRGAFMNINVSLQQIAGGFAAACVGLIVVQKDKFSPLEHYNTLGYIIVVVSLVSIYLLSRVSSLVKKKIRETKKNNLLKLGNWNVLK